MNEADKYESLPDPHLVFEWQVLDRLARHSRRPLAQCTRNISFSCRFSARSLQASISTADVSGFLDRHSSSVPRDTVLLVIDLDRMGRNWFVELAETGLS